MGFDLKIKVINCIAIWGEKMKVKGSLFLFLSKSLPAGSKVYMKKWITEMERILERRKPF